MSSRERGWRGFVYRELDDTFLQTWVIDKYDPQTGKIETMRPLFKGAPTAQGWAGARVDEGVAGDLIDYVHRKSLPAAGDPDPKRFNPQTYQLGQRWHINQIMGSDSDLKGDHCTFVYENKLGVGGEQLKAKADAVLAEVQGKGKGEMWAEVNAHIRKTLARVELKKSAAKNYLYRLQQLRHDLPELARASKRITRVKWSGALIAAAGLAMIGYGWGLSKTQQELK